MQVFGIGEIVEESEYTGDMQPPAYSFNHDKPVITYPVEQRMQVLGKDKMAGSML